jgi:hypothetical protein
MASVTDPYGGILGFLDRTPHTPEENRVGRNSSYVGYQVLTVVVMKSSVFFFPAASLKVIRRFGETYCFDSESKSKPG